MFQHIYTLVKSHNYRNSLFIYLPGGSDLWISPRNTPTIQPTTPPRARPSMLHCSHGTCEPPPAANITSNPMVVGALFWNPRIMGKERRKNIQKDGKPFIHKRKQIVQKVLKPFRTCASCALCKASCLIHYRSQYWSEVLE